MSKDTNAPRSARVHRVENHGPAFRSTFCITRAFLPALVLFAAAVFSANAVNAQTISEKRSLQFGTVAGSGESTGSVTISTTGAVSTSGSAIDLGGMFRSAQFQVTGTKNTNVILILPSTATISAGGSTATLSSFVADPPAGVPQSLGGNGRLLYNVGVTLEISAGQAAGSYAGIFDVFADPG